MTGKRKFDDQFGGTIEAVGIVGEENIGHVAADQWFHSAEHLLFAATGRAFALPSRDFHGSVAYDDGPPGDVGCLFAGR